MMLLTCFLRHSLRGSCARTDPRNMVHDRIHEVATRSPHRLATQSETPCQLLLDCADWIMGLQRP